MMAQKYEELEAMDRDQLIAHYNLQTKNVVTGLSFMQTYMSVHEFRDALARLETLAAEQTDAAKSMAGLAAQQAQSAAEQTLSARKMEELTVDIKRLTVICAIFGVLSFALSVIVAAIAYFS